MEKAVLFRLCLSLLAICVAGCATSARDLPPDASHLSPIQRIEAKPFGKRDLARTCADLLDERVKVSAAIEEIDAALARRRGDEQAVGYVAATLFFPAALLVSQDDLPSRSMDLSERRDWLTSVILVKGCAA